MDNIRWKLYNKIKNKIGQIKTEFFKIKIIICNESLSLEVRKAIIAYYIESVLMYDYE